MVCIVSGFPSNIAALQMEWALHNPHLSRHIDNEKRISFAVTKVKTNAKTGKTRRKPGRPTTSLLEKLSNLHLLLRAPYFSQWPLEVRFFSEDVYRSWQSWCERVDEQLDPSLNVMLDLPQPREVEVEDITSGQRPSKRRKTDLIGKGGIDGIDPTYAQLLDVLQKGRFILDEGDGQQCTLCASTLNLENDLYTICPSKKCRSLTHIRCLAKHFLMTTPGESLVPKRGKCPTCQSPLEWLELMKEVSLRARGQKDIQKVLSKRGKTAAATAADILESESEGEPYDPTDTEGEADDDADARSDVSIESFSTVMSRTLNPSSQKELDRLEIVIEDSDDDRG